MDEGKNLKEDKRRKARYNETTDSFQLLKPIGISEDGNVTGWHNYGQQRSIKAVYDIIQREEPYKIVEMDNKTKEEFERYKRAKEKNEQK